MAPWTDRQFVMDRDLDLGMHVRSLRSTGDASGTIFYIHGLGESGLCFERLIAEPRLASWNHIAPDLVGYGKSTWGAEPLSLAEHAWQLDRFLDRTEPSPVVVLGHSMGGALGVLFAETYPRRVRALVNVEGNVSLSDCHFSGKAAEYPLDDWLSHGLDEVIAGIFAAERKDDDGEGESAAVLRPYCASIQMCDPRAFHRNAIELVEASIAGTMAKRMAALASPSIYLYGSPRGSGEMSRDLLKEAGVTTFAIKGSGHWPFLDQHQVFVDNLVLLLDQIAPQG